MNFILSNVEKANVHQSSSPKISTLAPSIAQAKHTYQLKGEWNLKKTKNYLIIFFSLFPLESRSFVTAV